MKSASSINASGLPSKPEPSAQEQVSAQQEAGREENEASVVGRVEPACEAEKHLWATVEEKQGGEGAGEKDGERRQEGGVTGG